MENEPIIYTGPTDKKLGLRHNAIFSGALPEHLRETIESNSALANFFVPLERYAKKPRKRAATGAVSATLSRTAPPTRQIGPPIKKKR
jgi:hypothetical protein